MKKECFVSKVSQRIAETRYGLEISRGFTIQAHGWKLLCSFIGLLLAGCTLFNPALLVSFDYPEAAIKAAKTGGQEKPTLTFAEPPPGDASAWLQHVELSGSYYELGRQIGFISLGTPIRPRVCTPKERDFNNDFIALYRGFYPAYLELLRGIAEAQGKRLEDIDLRYMEEEFFVELGWIGLGYAKRQAKAFRALRQKCSIIGIHTEDGRVLIGRNFDWLQPNGSVVHASMDNEYSFTGMTLICPEQWVMDGVNSEGLFTGVLSISDNGPNRYAERSWHSFPTKPSVDAHHLQRIIMACCATVKEAIAMAKTVPVYYASEAIHLFVADAGGDMAVLEFAEDGSTIVVRPMDPRYMIATNFWLSEPNQYEAFFCWRYQFAQSALSKAVPNDMDGLQAIMNAISVRPGSPLLASVAPNEPFDFVRTVWTSFYDLQSRAGFALYYFGSGIERYELPSIANDK